jgi:opacity protein-like surface antigen
MSKKNLLLLVLVVTGTLSRTAPVWAQTTQGERSPFDARIEATIFAVPRSSTLARLGGSMTFFWTPRLGVEAEMTYGRDFLTSAGNLIWTLPSGGRLAPFVAGGVGLERQDFVDVMYAGDTVTQSRTRLAMTFGGGITVRIHNRVAIRGDVRWTNQRWRVGNGVSFRF